MNTLEQLKIYCEMGWRIFPIKAGCKAPPMFEGWKISATSNFEIVQNWYKKYPNCNWGLATGKKSGVIAIDLDLYKGKEIGLKFPKTLISITGSGGVHAIYKYPKSSVGNSVNDEVATDIKSDGGYIVLPPSIHPNGNPYRWNNWGEEIAEIPMELLNLISPQREVVAVEIPQYKKMSLDEISELVWSLNPERADGYDSWKDVGMAIHSETSDSEERSRGGLKIWDAWSRQSEKYENSKCAEKWESFHEEGNIRGRITIGTLIMWAKEDSGYVKIPFCKKGALPDAYYNALHLMNYHFSMNEMNDYIYLNGNLLTDGMEALINIKMREHGYNNTQLIREAIIAEGYENQFHPIRDYLESLVWDGKDHFSNLCSYFKDKDGIFPLLLKKWGIGAVNKNLGNKEHTPMLVLDGRQGMGKSKFVSWLCSGIPEFLIVNCIIPEDKDFRINKCSYFIWEVEELGSTIRKADREALKAFLSKELITERLPYGHRNMSKFATVNFIGTLNGEGGFLTDPTGNRRFMICTLESIDWNYSKDINVNQFWAQMVALFKAGETKDFSKEENEQIMEINKKYEIEDVLEFYMMKHFDIDPKNREYFTPTASILYTLKAEGVQINEVDRQTQMRVGQVLTKFGCEKDRKVIEDKKYSGWYGIKPKIEYTTMQV